MVLGNRLDRLEFLPVLIAGHYCTMTNGFVLNFISYFIRQTCSLLRTYFLG